MACCISPRLPLRWLACLALATAGLGCAAPAARAQNFDATNLHEPQYLSGTWLIHSGDDPAWAQPGFDDSHWTRCDPSLNLKSWFPGGKPDVVWYRLHVTVAPSETGLALSVQGFSSAFEVYVNGERFLQNGRIAPFTPYTTGAIRIEPIPARAMASGALTIALRVHFSGTDWNVLPGINAQTLMIGQEPALRDHRSLLLIGDNALDGIGRLTDLGLGIVALALFAAQRRQTEHLWIFLLGFCSIATYPLSAYEYVHSVPAAWNLLYLPFNVGNFLFMVLMYLSILRIPFRLWFRVLFAVAAAVNVFAAIEVAQGNASALVLDAGILPLYLLVYGVAPVLIGIQWRRGNREAGILLIPAILSGLFYYIVVVFIVMFQFRATMGLAMRWGEAILAPHVGPIVLNLRDIADLLFDLSLAIIIIRRSMRISSQQAFLEGELAAAREVQQVILPEQRVVLAGFEIESEYRPAREVGGDFFQIVPHEQDGSMLIVAGDVTGKGLKAGMLVALLVGAIRSTVESTTEPLAMLQALNRRLLGRHDAQATCLVLRIEKDGTATLANAGHLAPYLNGEPLEMMGALPLGMMEGAEFSVMNFNLNERDRLVLMSDGIAEATDAQGKLFGFERVLELVRTGPSAASIAETARAFGQEDDISVIAVTRMAAQPAPLTPLLARSAS
ncbi:MAG TPA: PP2C family protein-serine/threonine phosphatase [Terracidiphilus sp.]|jgi:hypothetical protein|nr:PP2C family protein-serine/threonine phosphatase [Terracidiphilus sp.]